MADWVPPRLLPAREIPTEGVFLIGTNEGTSFKDGAVNIGKTGTNSFISCPKMLIDTSTLIPNGIAISENFLDIV